MRSFFPWKQCAVTMVTRWNPWAWLTVVYGLQVLGALAVTHLFGLNFKKTGTPILLLVLGTVVSFVIGCLDFPPIKRIWKFWIPAAVYAMFISTLSHSSFPDTSISFDTNLFHPVEYMTLAIFFCWAWYPLMSHRSRSSFVIAVLATGTLFGMADEIHQAFVPGRDSSLGDLVLDVVGLCIGVGLFMAARHAHDLLKLNGDDSHQAHNTRE